MEPTEHSFYLDAPARRWDVGLPLGNGRLGAMVQGKINDETIVLNEETLWYGAPKNRLSPDAPGALPEIRRLLLADHPEQASFLAKMALTGQPKYNNPYQPMGDLRISWQGCHGQPVGYRRTLNLATATATVEYDLNGLHYCREHFVSARYQVLVVRLRCQGATGQPAGQTLCANLNRKPFEEATGLLDERTTGCWGQNGSGGLLYCSGLRLLSSEGHITGDFVWADGVADSTLLVACQTNFEAPDADPAEVVLARLNRAEEDGYDAIRQAHLADHAALYNRMDFSLAPPTPAVLALSAPALLQAVREGSGPALNRLCPLLFRFARYLMISSSHNCLLPANLQGIWNGEYAPPWQSEFTININTEMNYWFVEAAALPECHLPLFALLDRMVEDGRETARTMYGCRGFCAHHNTNLWACTAPEGIFAASPFWVMGGAWLALHLYEHYRYSGDTAFLRARALPVMRQALLFFRDYLTPGPDGTLLTGPCVSPENAYRTAGGEVSALTMGPTMDNMILRELIEDYLAGCQIAGEPADAAPEELAAFATIKAALPPTTQGPDGRILEWRAPYEETEPGHQHISHLYGLHPGREITVDTPALLAAARKTLAYRMDNGGGHTGWSRAWLACFAARLQDGELALDQLRQLAARSMQDNLLDTHPPFQIDGNFGLADAMLEMLVQTQTGSIRLLPALPKDWPEGELRGVRLPGGLQMDLIWKDCAPCWVQITANADTEALLCWKTHRLTLLLAAGVPQEISQQLLACRNGGGKDDC